MSKSARRILIIKTGYSEFLDRGISTTVSLGDVLICTSLLHLFEHDRVTWVTSFQAKTLLQGITQIQELLVFGSQTMEYLRKTEPFDLLINLEKDIGISTFAAEVKANKRFGFYFSDHTHSIETRFRATRFLLAGQENHRDIQSNALEILYETVGKKWQRQGLILNKPKRTRIEYDFGFNYEVGTKWPTKAWSKDHWHELERLLGSDYSISWQQGHKNLLKYIHWINACRVIVTSDSLGQAIGSALGKKVITLYGPTNSQRMQSVPHVEVIPSTLKCPYMPCYLPFCKFDKFCMDYISPEKVAAHCRAAIKRKS